MIRDLTPEVYAAIKQQQVRLAYLVEFELALTTARFWSRRGNLDWQGVKWYGFVGPNPTAERLSPQGSVMVSISRQSETAEIKTTSVSFTMSAVPVYDESGRNLLEQLIDYTSQGGRAQIWSAFYNLTTGALLNDPVRIFNGIVDTPIFEPSGKQFTITVVAQSRLSKVQNRAALRYNHETQQSRRNGAFAGDLFFEFTARGIHQVDDFGP